MKPRSICLTLALVAAVAGAFALPAAAQATDNFTCRASALRVTSPLVNSEAVVANRKNNPCEDETAQLANAGVPGLATANVLNAETDNQSDGATSNASAANVNVALGGRVITATVLRSNAAVRCVGGTPFQNQDHPGTPGRPVFSGSSSVATVNVSGLNPIVVTGQPNQTIKVPANGSILTIVINEQIQQSDRITVRALRISSPLLRTDVVVAESIADVSGQPCGTPHR